jgi:protein-tyrosine phosphatase
LDFVPYPIPDRGVPDSHNEITEMANSLVARIARGESALIHCRAGIGRSALVAACVLVSGGIEASTALGLIALARGLMVPDTEEQRDLISRLPPRSQVQVVRRRL